MSTPIDHFAYRLAQLENDNAAMRLVIEEARLRVQNAEQRVETSEQNVAASELRYSVSEQRANRERRRLRLQAGLAFAAFIAAIFVSPANRAAIAQTVKPLTLAGLDARLSVLEGKTQFQSADSLARSTTFSGCNVIVNNGSGSTSTIANTSTSKGIQQGLGNLIIGYNATGVFQDVDVRTGSHNLILGDGNNYSSYGGIIAGSGNAISAPYACVTGGYENSAIGANSSVSGGSGNIASGQYASVTGGYWNQAMSWYTSVTGGTGNTALCDYASVSGGAGNRASGQASSVSGGYTNQASGWYASISGGKDIFQSSYQGWSAGNSHTP